MRTSRRPRPTKRRKCLEKARAEGEVARLIPQGADQPEVLGPRKFALSRATHLLRKMVHGLQVRANDRDGHDYRRANRTSGEL